MGQNPLNTIKAQMNMPVQTVSSPSTEDMPNQKVEEVTSPIDLSNLDNMATEVTEEVKKDIPTDKVKPVPQVGVASRQLTRKELDEITGADLLDEALVARPLTVPEHLEPKCRDSNKMLRWVQFKAQGGIMYEKALSQGFRNATRADLAQDSLQSELLISKEGVKQEETIRYHDTILMIIDKAKLKGAYAYNVQKSVNRLRGANAAARNLGRKDFQDSISNYHAGEKDVVGGVNPEIDKRYAADPKMIQFYNPDINEVGEKLK